MKAISEGCRSLMIARISFSCCRCSRPSSRLELSSSSSSSWRRASASTTSGRFRMLCSCCSASWASSGSSLRRIVTGLAVSTTSSVMFSGSDGRQGPAAAAFVGGYIREGGFGDFDRLRVHTLAVGVNLYRNGDGRAAFLDDLGVETQKVAHENRLLENKGIDRDRGNTPSGPACSRNRARNVDLGHDPAAEDIPMDVGVFGHGHDAQHRLTNQRLGEGVLGAHFTAPGEVTPQSASRNGGTVRRGSRINRRAGTKRTRILPSCTLRAVGVLRV